ncbi:putative F-box domain-containing protein [Helianthus anomalus]
MEDPPLEKTVVKRPLPPSHSSVVIYPNHQIELRMSSDYYVPIEILAEILKLLPVKSLVQFRSVSKRWKSLIDGSEFIAGYSNGKHLLLSREGPGGKYVSIDDDDDATFPHQKASLTMPVLLNRLRVPVLLGSSHGVFFFYGYTNDHNTLAVLYNPSIRKAVGVVVPFVRADGMTYLNILGFGVCSSSSSDPKIVNLTRIKRYNSLDYTIPWQVQVFTLSTATWRSPHSSNPPPRRSIELLCLQVLINGVLYWLAYDKIPNDGGCRTCKLVIISFDMTTEEFGEITPPHSVLRLCPPGVSLSQLRDSLVLFERNVKHTNDNLAFVVWVMEDGVSKSFTKLYSVHVGTPFASLGGFRKSGELIIELSEQGHGIYKLLVYDPCSKRTRMVRSDGTRCVSSMYPYMETLLLLDQTNLTVYDEIETIKLATP